MLSPLYAGLFWQGAHFLAKYQRFPRTDVCSRAETQTVWRPRQNEFHVLMSPLWCLSSEGVSETELRRGPCTIRVLPAAHFRLSLGTIHHHGMLERKNPFPGLQALSWFPRKQSCEAVLIFTYGRSEKGIIWPLERFLCASEGKICFVLHQVLKNIYPGVFPFFLSTWKPCIFKTGCEIITRYAHYMEMLEKLLRKMSIRCYFFYVPDITSHSFTELFLISKT